ncbi:MAG: hypothetical protein N2049_01930 [Anaerolineales bacterium]|nr:hypothetical protein [Anaerolineales bacterium]MCX7607965.1 hypothetical protein [Anaerolineales bacterium]MDW8226601.1 hypothetical protein [Anaerolineales bacterium]
MPRALKLFRFFLWLNALWNGLRLVGTIRFWNILNEYQAHGGALYQAATGSGWMLVGLTLIFLLRRPRLFVWRAALGFLVTWEIWFWLDRLFIQEPRVNNLFILPINLLWLTVSLLILLSSHVRSYYHGRYI